MHMPNYKLEGCISNKLSAELCAGLSTVGCIFQVQPEYIAASANKGHASGPMDTATLEREETLVCLSDGPSYSLSCILTIKNDEESDKS